MTPRMSVVIPAHDEEAVIGRLLSALTGHPRSAELELVVAANGCTDGTVDVARSFGASVTVVEVASLALRRATGAALAHRHRRHRLARRWGRRPILRRGRRDLGRHALHDRPTHDQDAVEPVQPHANLVARPDRQRRLRPLAVHADMTGAARRGRGRARLARAHGPEPRVHARRPEFRHPASLGRRSQRISAHQIMSIVTAKPTR